MDLTTQLTFYEDSDDDGFGHESNTTTYCSLPGGYVDNNSDCNDEESTVYPNAPEICDNIDNNCNELIDESDPEVFYLRVQHIS